MLLSNLFGTVNARSGFAVFTTKDFNHFVFDRIRYLRYYFVRYAFSFLQPDLKTHNDQSRKSCVFHKKIRKLEILDSLNSGEICDQCREKLKPKLTGDIKRSVESLLKLVSNQYPFALLVKGGGVKGLAFVGALLELEKHFSFDTFAGTSAGAITSVLLGAGYSPTQLQQIMEEKNFKDFLDASIFGKYINFLKTRGLYPGDHFEKWLNDLLSKKYPEKLKKIKMSDLEFRTLVYSARTQDGTLTFDSKGARKDVHAAFAARCSMSIPYFFSPKTVDGIKVYDGGMRNNFPLTVFTSANPHKPFIGMYLVSDLNRGNLVIEDLINIAIEGEELTAVENHIKSVVVIDPRPIKTTEFNLSKEKKEYLVNSGRLGAL